MSTGSDTGGEDRRNEPTLATVWRLHVGDEEDSSTAEEWYENERLSGHITGGAPRVAPTDRSAPAQENGPAILDWRYEPLTPPPGVRQRLNEALGRRFGRGRPLRSGSEEPRQPSDPVVDQDAETEVTEPAAEQDIVPRAAEAATDAEPAISLRGDTSVPSGDAPRRRTAILALCLAVVAAAVAAPILLSGNRTHSASRAAADTGSAVRSNPLLSIAPHIAPTRTGSRKAKVTETPPHRAKRKAQRSRRRASAVRRRHSAAHATSTVAHASIHTTSPPATAVTSPTATTPTGASTSPTGGSSSPSPTSSAGSSSSSGTHSSSAAKQPAFGATGALGPGSSPDG